MILCIPNIPDCGGFIIGVDSMDPNTPPLEIVKVPPVISSTVISPSPAAKKIIDERGINSSDIKGSGRGGRITKNDALNAVPSMGSKPEWGERQQNREKLSMLRRKVAERLVEAKNETAMLMELLQ